MGSNLFEILTIAPQTLDYGLFITIVEPDGSLASPVIHAMIFPATCSAESVFCVGNISFDTIDRSIVVSTAPGAMVYARTPCSPYSLCNARVSPSIAALVHP